MTQITKVLEDGQGDVLKNVVGVRAADQGHDERAKGPIVPAE